VVLGLSNPEFKGKWGDHYTRSLVCAHRLQQCHNYKDPSVQQYGGAQFKTIVDAADAAFCTLPAPKGRVVQPQAHRGCVSPPPLPLSCTARLLCPRQHALCAAGIQAAALAPPPPPPTPPQPQPPQSTCRASWTVTAAASPPTPPSPSLTVRRKFVTRLLLASSPPSAPLHSLTRAPAGTFTRIHMMRPGMRVLGGALVQHVVRIDYNAAVPMVALPDAAGASPRRSAAAARARAAPDASTQAVLLWSPRGTQCAHRAAGPSPAASQRLPTST